MSKKTVLAGVARFAHLLGVNPRAEEPKDEDPDAPVQGEDESDEDFAKRCDEYEKDKKAKGAKKDGEGEGDDPDADPDAEGDDDSEEAKAARKAERARCAAIFGTKAAAVRPDMAAHLAFETSMSASKAINMLGAIAAGQPKGSSLASRMSSVKPPVVGSELPRDAQPQSSAAAATAKAIVAAAARARGEKPAAN